MLDLLKYEDVWIAYREGTDSVQVKYASFAAKAWIRYEESMDKVCIRYIDKILQRIENIKKRIGVFAARRLILYEKGNSSKKIGQKITRLLISGKKGMLFTKKYNKKIRKKTAYNPRCCWEK